MEDSEVFRTDKEDWEPLLPGALDILGGLEPNAKPFLGPMTTGLDRHDGRLVSLPGLLSLQEGCQSHTGLMCMEV